MYSLADIISLSGFVPYVLVVTCIPSRFALYLIGGLGLLTLGVSGIKRATVYIADDVAAFHRPRDAHACDLFCLGGSDAHAPGFPSGHVATIAFFGTAVWLWADRSAAVGLLGVVWVILMGWARWVKSCHTLLQITSGAVVGIVSGAVLFLAYRQNEVALST